MTRKLSDFRHSIESFLAEDLGRGDATTRSTVPPELPATGILLAKSALVASGLDVAEEVFRQLDPEIRFRAAVEAGSPVPAGVTMAEVAGRAAALLSAERVALNLLQRMCGIATTTRAFVELVAGTGASILDTRKTAPGLRLFDKRAVAEGGGRNHRFGLDDGILIKDNHIRIAGGVASALSAAKQRAGAMLRIEVEVESLSDLDEALAAGADIVLLDNRSPEEVGRMVARARAKRPAVLLEASGGITLDNARAYAEAGVDFLSVGALTHSVRAADISLELRP